jgi:hypothetical protein
VANRFGAHWPAKLALGILLALFFCACYLAIGHNPLRPPARLQLTELDRWVEFSPGWVWAYQSLYLLLPVAWLCESTDQLRRYAIGFLILSSIGFLCFLLWPVAGPRPPELDTGWMYGLLVRYDTALNSFPSLHIALATYSASVGIAVSSGGLRRIMCFALPAWVALIGYSTLATKQHYVVDLPPGVALGWLAQLIAWRGGVTDRLKTKSATLVDEGTA